METSITCPKCGKPARRLEQKFCVFCGASLGGFDTALLAKSATQPVPLPPPSAASALPAAPGAPSPAAAKPRARPLPAWIETTTPARPLAEACLELGASLAARGLYREALEALERALSEPDSAGLRRKLIAELAHIAEVTADVERAVRAYLEAALLDANASLAILDRAHDWLNPGAALRLNSWIQSEWLPRATALNLSNPQRAGVELFLGRLHLFLADYDQALEHFGIAMRSSPEEVGATFLSFLNGDKLPPALAVRDDGNARLILAKVLRVVGRLDAALAEVQHALELGFGAAPNADAPALELKGDLLAATGQKEPAAGSYYQAGCKFYWSSEFDNANRAFSRSMDLRQNHQPTYWYLADILLSKSYLPRPPYVDLQSITQSRSIWQRGLEVDSRNAPTPDFAWAYVTAALANEQWAKLHDEEHVSLNWQAVVWLNRSLLLDDGNAFCWGHLGRFHRGLENELTALQVTAEALERADNNLVCLQERAAILANIGLFDEALAAIEKRLKLADDPWCRDVKSYILIRLGARDSNVEQLKEALTLMNQTVEAGEELWNRLMRGLCQELLGNREPAQRDYEWIWSRRTDPVFNSENNRTYFASAGFCLYLLSCRADYLAQAMLIDEELQGKPGQRREWELGLALMARGQPGDLEKGEGLLRLWLPKAINARECRNLWNITVKLFLDYSQQWPHGAQVRASLARLCPEVEARAAVLEAAVPRTPEEEVAAAAKQMKLAAQRSAGTAPALDWCALGAQAELARLLLRQKQWAEAADTYLKLQQAREFPEAALGVRKAAKGLTQAADQRLKHGDLDAAAAAYAQALDLYQKLIPPASQSFVDLHARLALVEFFSGHADSARNHLTAALDWCDRAKTNNPGNVLGGLWRSLVPNISRFWALSEAWPDLTAGLGEQGSARQTILAEARQVFELYPSERYELSAGSGAAAGLMHIVTPVVLEIGHRLTPPAPEEKSALFEKYLPEMRNRIFQQTGVRVPGVRVRSVADDFRAEAYAILLDEVQVARGNALAGQCYCLASKERLRTLGITAVEIQANPLAGEEGAWIEPRAREVAESHGLVVWTDALRFIVAHIEAVLHSNLADFLGVQEVENTLSSRSQDTAFAKLAQAALPNETARLRFARLLRLLVRERVPLTNLKEILESVKATGLPHQDLAEVLRAARLRLKSQLPGNQPNATRLALPVEVETRIANSIRHHDGKTFFAILPEDTQQLLSQIRELVGKHDSNRVLVTRDAALRPFVRRLLEVEFPDLMVLAHEELTTPQNVVELSNLNLSLTGSNNLPTSLPTSHA